MAVRVLEETGLLPHLNPGVMSWEEINRLKPVSPSMGMMLETTSPPPASRRRARPTSARPTRTPPCGCGCSRTPAGSRCPSPPGCWSASARRSPSGPRRSSRCAGWHRAYGSAAGGHRPELPGQARHRDAPPRRPRPRRVPRRDRGHPPGPRAPAPRVQAPPNLVDARADVGRVRAAAGRRRRRLGRRLAAHARPRQPRAALALAWSALRAITADAGFELAAAADRPPGVRPRRAGRRRPWLDPRLLGHVAALAGPDGLARARRTTGRAGRGRSPTAASPLRPGPAAPTCTPRSTPRVAPTTAARDFSEVYGDWDVGARGRGRRHRSRRRPTGAPAPRCRRGPRGAGRGRGAIPGAASLSDEHALTLMTADGDAARRGLPPRRRPAAPRSSATT